jgi:hypothetical protein
MSEHSTAELKRQLDAANSRSAAFAALAIAAKKSYSDALIADRLAVHAANGVLPGSKVILSSAIWSYALGRDTVARKVVGFWGVDAGYRADTPEDILSDLKKDGTPSKTRKHFHSGTIEPYEGSPEQASEVNP